MQATNIYGTSVESNQGNGAVILTYPDAPINLQEDLSEKDGDKIGLMWEEGPSNGGTTVRDYRLSYD